MKERIIIVALLIAVAALSLRSCFRKEKENSILKDVVESKNDSTTFWKDAAGREHAQRKVVEANISTIKAVFRAEIDSITGVLKIREKDIQGFISAGHQTSGEIKPRIDTVQTPTDTSYLLQYDDRWLSLSGRVGKVSFLRYQVRDSLIFTTYSKRVGLFRREVYLDGYSLNPSAQITGITSLRISAPAVHRFGAGPYVGYGFDGRQWAPSAGISVHYSLIKF